MYRCRWLPVVSEGRALLFQVKISGSPHWPKKHLLYLSKNHVNQRL